MHCDACVESIERVVGRLEGVESVNVDLSTELATVNFDDQLVTLAELGEAIEDAGFDVESSKKDL